MSEVHEMRLFPKGLGANKVHISGIAARCDVVVLSDKQSPQAHIVKRVPQRPKRIFISLRNAEAALSAFSTEIMPILGEPFVVISGSVDSTFPVQLDSRFPPYAPNARSVIEAALSHPLLAHWYAENLSDTSHDKMSPLPLGMIFETDEQRNAFRVEPPPMFRSRAALALCAARVRSGPQWEARKRVGKLAVGTWKGLCTTISEEVKEAEFVELVRSHAFTLCVEGGGLDPAPKAWLTMLNGGVPIIKSGPLDAAYRLLPVEFVSEWNDEALSLEKLNSWFEKWAERYANADFVAQVAERLGLDYWWNAIVKATPIAELEA